LVKEFLDGSHADARQLFHVCQRERWLLLASEKKRGIKRPAEKK